MTRRLRAAAVALAAALVFAAPAVAQPPDVQRDSAYPGAATDGSLTVPLALDTTTNVWRSGPINVLCTGPITVAPGGVVNAMWSQEVSNANWGANTGYQFIGQGGVLSHSLIMVISDRLYTSTSACGRTTAITPWQATNWDAWTDHYSFSRTGVYVNTTTASQTLYFSAYVWFTTEAYNVMSGRVPSIRVEPGGNYGELVTENFG